MLPSDSRSLLTPALLSYGTALLIWLGFRASVISQYKAGMFIKLFKKSVKTSSLVVDAITAIVDGNAKASPIGKAPRLSQARKTELKRKYHPSESSYINDDLGHVETLNPLTSMMI